MTEAGWGQRPGTTQPTGFGMPVLRALLCFSMFVLSSVALAAQVQVRESIIATAMRCSVIADSHQWLDCFYGSAQEMRQSLRLAPAPASQLRLTQTPPSGGTVYDADIRVSVLSAAVNCAKLEDDHKWLNCYYGSTDPIRLRLGLQPISPTAPSPVPLPQPDTVAAPAMSNVMAAAAGPAVATANGPTRYPVVSRVKSFSFNQLGVFTIALDNGQTWRQLAGDTNNAGHIGANEVITISRGAFGSYNLRIGKRSEFFKVERIP
jgi:hypothetical protein